MIFGPLCSGCNTLPHEARCRIFYLSSHPHSENCRFDIISDSQFFFFKAREFSADSPTLAAQGRHEVNPGKDLNMEFPWHTGVLWQCGPMTSSLHSQADLDVFVLFLSFQIHFLTCRMIEVFFFSSSACELTLLDDDNTCQMKLLSERKDKTTKRTYYKSSKNG